MDEKQFKEIVKNNVIEIQKTAIAFFAEHPEYRCRNFGAVSSDYITFTIFGKEAFFQTAYENCATQGKNISDYWTLPPAAANNGKEENNGNDRQLQTRGQ